MAQMQKQTDAEMNKPTAHRTEEETSLRGTFASVMILGALIILSWLSVFFLFLERQ
ncbi:cytochrome c oxidase subunit 2A [Tumebacillus algifaecis]|uniref:cytochrome c oxidase subunit 2A n=1 Tax=Tumebacillus algifaecis TaxID=1214604 RepID=UPI001D1311DF|nr:cytochrome c oxidase subunit 2A [Tumebacillus algifaecis]